jgi:hypothetical protein
MKEVGSRIPSIPLEKNEVGHLHSFESTGPSRVGAEGNGKVRQILGVIYEF